MLDDCKCHMVERDILAATVDSVIHILVASVTRASGISASDTHFLVG
jgi:hypothetical protein